MALVLRACLQTLSIFYAFVQASSTTVNGNQTTSSDIEYSLRSNSDYSFRSSYSPGSNYYTPRIYNPDKSFYNPPSGRAKGDAAYSTYPGSGYSYRNYNTIPAASTVYNNYKGIPAPNHGYYGKGTGATDYYRPTSGYLQGRDNKNNWQDNYRLST